MKSLFICTTPFQIMNSVVIANHMDDVSNLVILDKFKGSEHLCKDVQKCRVFHNVCLFDDSLMWASKNKSWLLQRLSTVWTYVRCKKLVEKFFPEISTYTDIFVSSRAQVNRLVYMYVSQWMTDVKIHFFDDGLGSYSGSIIEVSSLDRFLRKTIIGEKAVDFEYDLYLYSPELYRGYHNKDIAINKIDITDKDKDVIRKIFQLNIGDITRGENILFDTIPTDEFTPQGVIKYREIVQQIIDRENIVIKQHPRNTEARYNAPYFENTSIPFEVYCSQKNYDNSVFFTSCSTAVFTPKLIYDQEPSIVFLYKALSEYRKSSNSDCDKLVSCLKRMYKNPRKIMVIHNVDELHDIMLGMEKDR